MATATELAAWLSEAETALHRLMTGSRVEEVQFADRRVRYTAANIGDLQKYIASLKQQIESAARGSRKPILFEFQG